MSDHDVKKINKKIDHLETSVCQLKRDSKVLKDQNAHFTKQVNELSHLYQNKNCKIKNRRLKKNV